MVISPSVGPACFAGPLARPLAGPVAGEEGQVEGQFRVWRRLFLCCKRVAGVQEAWPPPGGCERESLGFSLGSAPRAAKASLYSSLSLARAGQVDLLPAGVPDRQALLECVARPRFVGLYEGVLLGKVGSPGVVAVDGRFRSRWCDVPRRVPWREEVIPRPPCRLLPCVWRVRDSRCACVAVRRRCRPVGRLRLRALGGFPRVAQGRCGGH